MSRVDNSAPTSGGVEDSVAMPSDAFGVFMLSTDVDAMSEGGTPALLHVSLDPNSSHTGAVAAGADGVRGAHRGGAGNGGDTLLNKMLIGGFSTCLKRKRGMLLETLVRRLSRRNGGGGGSGGGKAVDIFQSIAHRVSHDAQDAELNAVLHDTFQWDLEHGRCCYAGLVPSTSTSSGSSGVSNAAPLLLCLLVPADVAHLMVPPHILYLAVLWVLHQHCPPGHAGIAEFVHACAAATGVQALPESLVATAGVSNDNNAVAASRVASLLESFSMCKRQLFQLLSATSTAGSQLERSARLHELHLSNSATVGQHTQQHHYLAEWWATVHRMMIMAQPKSLQLCGDYDDDDDSSPSRSGSVEELLRRHVYQRRDSEQQPQDSTLFPATGVKEAASQQSQPMFVIQGVGIWKHGHVVYGSSDIVTRSKPILLQFAADITHSRDWTLAQSMSSSSSDQATLLSRWRTPSTRIYVVPPANSDGGNIGLRAVPAGFISASVTEADRVVVGSLGTVFVTLWLSPIPSKLRSLGCTEATASLGLEKFLWDVSSGAPASQAPAAASGGRHEDRAIGEEQMRRWHAVSGDHAWPRTIASLWSPGGAAGLITPATVARKQSSTIITPLGFEVRLFEALNALGDPSSSEGVLVASYLRHASGYALAPISAYLPEASQWLEQIQTSSFCYAPTFTARKFVPLLHRRLRFAASVNGGGAADHSSATLILEHTAVTSATGIVVAVILLMPSSVPTEVARRFSSSLIATFSE